ncbi:hypothetical protein [Bacteroides clarus]|jgi:hypothetical protein
MRTRNYARFYVLLGRMSALDKEELKVQLVRQFTDGRTESLKEMTDKEYTAMCDGMQQQIGNYKSREIYREELRRKRSAVLHLLQKIGVDTTDWERVNAYCRNPRISGKEFSKLTIEELEILSVKLRIIRRKDNNSNKQLLN